MKQLSIRSYLILLITVMTAIPLAIISYDARSQLRRNHEASYVTLEQLAQDVESDQRALHNSIEQLLFSLEALPAVQQRNSAAATIFLRHLAKKTIHISNIYLTDTQGRVWASTVPTAGKVAIADRRHFVNAMATGAFASGEYVTGKILNKPIINFALPLRNEKEEINNVAAISFALANYSNLLASRTYSKATSLVLTDHRGIILYSSVGPEYAGRKDKLFQTMLTNRSGRFEAIGNSGTRRIHYFRPVQLKSEQTPYLYIRAGMASSALEDDINATLLKNFSLLFLLLLSASGITFFISKTLVLDKIEKLDRAMQRVANGDLSARVSDYVSGGELGRLGQSFDQMTDRLNLDITQRMNAEENVAKSEERLRIIFETSRAGIIMIDPAASITYANQRAAEMFGCSMEELIGSHYSDHLYPDEPLNNDCCMR